MPDLGGVIGAALLTALYHPETVGVVRIEILSAILEPCADCAALTGLQFNGELNFLGNLIIDRDRVAVHFR